MKPYAQIADTILYLPHRACDQCRSRKIRCDRQLPCCNCRLAKKQCAYTDASTRPRQPRARLGREDDKRTAGIEDRLARIEEALVALSKSQRLADVPMHIDSPDKGGSHPSMTPLLPQQPHRHHHHHSYHGSSSSGSSIEAQVAFACHYLQDIIDNSAPDEDREALGRSLSSLQRLAQKETAGTSLPASSVSSPAASPAASAPATVRLPHARALGSDGLRGLPMPPLEDVFALLRDLRRSRPVTFPMVCAFTSVDSLAEQCRRLYLPVRDDDMSLEASLTVNAALFFLFKDKMALAVHTGDQEAVVRFLALRNTCRDNVETALAHMPLALPPRPEGLLALVLAAGYGIEVSRPWLASRLNTAACQMCVELGYHRAEEDDDGGSSNRNGIGNGNAVDHAGDRGSPPRRTDGIGHGHVLFWLAYMHDRALALRLGRAPFLQDFDITVPRALAPLAAEFEGHRVNLSSWIVLGEVQGRMYRDIYSPAARRSALRPRIDAARACAEVLLREAGSVHRRRIRLEQRLRSWPSPAEEAGKEAESGPDSHDRCIGDDDRTAMEVEAMLLRVDEVTMLSSLTTAYRAIPPGGDEGDDGNESEDESEDEQNSGWKKPPPPQIESTLFCDDCIAMARKTMQMHLEYLHLTDGNPMLVAMHMHWTVLLVPFVPFVVLFCYVMEQPNAEDLCYLQRCTASLQPWQKLSTHAEQLFRICQALCEAAQVYVGSNSRRRGLTDSG